MGIKQLWDFKNYKYKDRDQLVDVFRRWSSKIEFDMEVKKLNKIARNTEMTDSGISTAIGTTSERISMTGTMFGG